MTRDAEKTTPFNKDDMKAAKSAASAASTARTRAVGPMFGNFEADKQRKMPKWAPPLLGAAVALHVVLFVSMWVKTIWDIEQLDRPKNSMDLAIAAPPPPPPPPPKGGAKPKDVVITPKKVKVKDIVQPVKIEKQEVAAPVETGDVNGVEGGVEGGAVGGDLQGVVAAPPPPPPPPPPAPPKNIVSAAFDALRISGEKLISPPDVTKTEISRSGKDKVIGSYKLCLNKEGAIATVAMLKSTGFAEYDLKIQNTIKGEWRYRPYVDSNGVPAPACTIVTFIYSQK
ncbi:MAG: hypothetical protein ABIY55_11160 [Kofleriaceae bacterium]